MVWDMVLRIEYYSGHRNLVEIKKKKKKKNV